VSEAGLGHHGEGHRALAVGLELHLRRARSSFRRRDRDALRRRGWNRRSSNGRAGRAGQSVAITAPMASTAETASTVACRREIVKGLTSIESMAAVVRSL